MHVTHILVAENSTETMCGEPYVPPTEGKTTAICTLCYVKSVTIPDQETPSA